MTSAGDEGLAYDQSARWHARTVRAEAEKIRADSRRVSTAAARVEAQFAATMQRLAGSQPHHAERLLALSRDARVSAEKKLAWVSDRARASATTGHGQAGNGGQPSHRTWSTRPGGAVTPAVMRSLIDSFTDAVVLTDENGIITLASQRLAAMFGYERGELLGRPVEKLIPAALRAVHRTHRSGYTEIPRIRLKDDRARLAGLRKDGTTILVEISLSPVPAAAGQYTLAVIRKAPAPWRHEYLPGSAPAGTAGVAHQSRELELLGRIVNNLLFAGLSLRGGTGIRGQVAGDRVAEALQWVDDTIREVRDHVLSAHPSMLGQMSD